jgi:hypothetical protein
MVAAGELPVAGVIAGAVGLELAGGTHGLGAEGAAAGRWPGLKGAPPASAARGSGNGGDSGVGLPIIIYLRWWLG